MKKSLAMKWVKALRSGKYKQGRGSLRSVTDEFCCLGVLCETAGIKSKLAGYREPSLDAYLYAGSETSLSYHLQKTFGVKEKYEEKLIGLNDFKQYSFKRIATYIEKNYTKFGKEDKKK